MADNTSNVSPDALTLNDRLAALQSNGHGWMDPTLQVHLAQNGGSTQQMLATADTYKNVVTNTGQAPTKAYADPSLNNPPSPIHQAFATLHNAYAPVPILQSDIGSIQQNMQAKGYGQGLTVGTWNPQWQQALNQHATDQMTAPGAGNTKSLPFWKKVLGEIAPTTWAPTITHAVASYIHNMPQEISNVIADSLSTLGTAADLATGSKNWKYESAVGSGVQNFLSNVLPAVKKITPEEYKQAADQGRFIQDIGNVINLIVLKGAGGALFKSIGAVGESLAANAAEQGTSSVAKNLVTRSLPEEFAATPRFTLVKSLYQAGAEGEKGTGLLRAFENVPALKGMLPAIDGLDAEGSRYYAYKQAMAQSMRIPAKQIAAQLQSKGTMAGLGLLGSSEAQKALGATPTFDASTVHSYGGYLGNALDVASTFVGAPTAGLSASQNVGKIVSKAHETYSNLLGAIGVDVPIKKALGVSLDDLKKNLGEEFVNDHFVNSKLTQYSVYHAANDMLNKDIYANKFDRGSQEAIDAFKNYSTDIMNNVAAREAARESLILQPAILAQYYKNDFAKQLGVNVKKGLASGYKDKQRFYDAMLNYKGLHEDVAAAHLPGNRNEYLGSAALTDVQNHLSESLSKDWATQHPSFNQDPFAEIGKGDKYYHLNPNVNEFAPEGNKLSASTLYGKGIWATQDPSIAGRAEANIFALKHNPAYPSENATFFDMTKKGNATAVTNKLSEMFKDQKTRDELGLARPVRQPTIVGKKDYKAKLEKYTDMVKTPDKYTGEEMMQAYSDMAKARNNVPDVASYEKTAAPAEFQKLHAMVKNRFDYTPQDILEQYRSALKNAGVLTPEQIRERMHTITSSIMQDKNHVGFHYIDPHYGQQTLLNPDKVTATLVKKDPSLTVDDMLPAYIRDKNVVNPGVLGWARLDSSMAQDAQQKARDLFKAMKKLGHDGDVTAAQSSLQLEERNNIKDLALPKFSKDIKPGSQEAKITKEAHDYLVRERGFAPNDVTRLDPIQAISQIWRDSKNSASRAVLPLNASKENIAAVEAAAKRGYGPVLGTDIGHSFDAPMVHPAIIRQRTSMLRKAALNLGIDPSKVSELSVAMARRTNVEDTVNNLIASGKVANVVGDDGRSIYNQLLQGAQSGLYTNQSRLSRFFRGGLSAMNESKLDAQSLGDITKKDYQEIKNEKAIARQQAVDTFNKAHQIRDLSLKQMVQILTRPIDPNGAVDNYLNQRYTPEDAMKIAKAVLIGYAKTPASLVGTGKIEDFIRASNAIATNATASFFGKVPLLKNLGIGEGPLANAFSELPNYLARARDKWRFDLNPVFAYRRLAKTNVKAAAEGIPPTRNPWEAMRRQGVTDQAFDTLNRTMPDVYRSYKELEPLDKFLQQSDVFGIYNPAHNMAWQAHNLEKMGLNDSEIAQKLVKINTYGDRTPLERTVNTIFYPFSFNKTLYRSVGGYVLDHPGESMLINAGFNLYQHYDPNNDFGKWVTKHAPLLNELKKLNAFEHGTGLGQFGGINAPYINEVMNLFSPQQIAPQNAAAAVKAWTNAIPALGELNTLLFNYTPSTGKANLQGSGVEAAKVGFWAGQNLVQHAVDMATGHKRLAYQTTLTDQGQVQAGLEVVNSLKNQLSQLMGNTNYKWPSTADVPKAVWGLPFNATSFGLYAKSLYPAYDPTQGAAIALQKNSEALQYVQNLQGTFRYDAYKQFQTLADKTISKLRKTNDPTAIQNAVNPLRSVAVNIAEQDGQFVKFYKKFYSNALGPIEGFTK